MMARQLSELISEGLHADNLEQIIAICDAQVARNPILYWTLRTISRALADEYQNQAVVEERYQQVNAALREPLLRLIQSGAVENPASVPLLRDLNRALLAFLYLNETGEAM